MNRLPMIEFLNGRPAMLDAEMPRKLEAIKRSLSTEVDVYAETNHSFIKGFGWLIPKYIPQDQLGVVILKRDPELVATSFHRIGVNAFNNGGRGWLIHANAKHSSLRRPQGIPLLLARYYYYRCLHRVYYFGQARPRLTFNAFKDRPEPRTPTDLNLKLLKWYVEQVHVLTDEFRRTFPKIRCFEIETDRLNSLDRVLELFDFFGLEAKDSLKAAIGVRINTKAEYSSTGAPTTA